MKWFKHMADARSSDSVRRIMDRLGQHKGYACYWLLTEACAQKWDGLSAPIFDFHVRDLADILRTKSGQTENILRTFQECSEIAWERTGNIIRITHPKLLQIKDNTSKNLQAASKSLGTRSRLEVDKNKNIKNIQKAAPKVAESDLENLYEIYPRKVGKEQGFRKLKLVAKTPEVLAEVKQAVENYTNYLKRENTDPKYIKHFSTFMSSWRDWLDPQAGNTKNFSSGETSKLSIDELKRRFGEA